MTPDSESGSPSSNLGGSSSFCMASIVLVLRRTLGTNENPLHPSRSGSSILFRLGRLRRRSALAPAFDALVLLP
eukprot:scaffold162357_cov35-Tisochrysis_lutea.AAC.1